ncbi:MAG: hypothetical protein NVS2B3_13380 [Vulcanimicrobiaceae bacterium]
MKILAIAIAVVCFVVAALYATGTLQLGAHEAGRHVKHAILFTVLGILALVWMRFQSGQTASVSSR